jgi:hypothetical protein
MFAKFEERSGPFSVGVLKNDVDVPIRDYVVGDDWHDAVVVNGEGEKILQ